MRTICLYFQVHQPFRLKKYRFFNIGNDHYYYNDYLNESVMKKIIEKCYFPANEILFDLIQKYNGKFKVAFSISGVAIKQFELYAPEVLKSFKKLAELGSVEFLAETNAHSLVALKDKQAFCEQVKTHSQKIEKHFNQSPSVFRNTELIYSDEIGATVSEMGYKAMLTEGAKHVLGWKSPNYLYCNAIKPRLKILLKNFKLSDDIAFRFSSKTWEEWPLTTEKFVGWLNNLDPKEEVVNLFMDYETFGEHQWHETGIFDFLKFLPETVFNNSNFTFSTPSEVAEKLQSVSAIHVPHPISWADEERDLTAWLGNDLQEEAFNKLYSLSGKISKCKDPAILEDWNWLQTSDHFYYMCTKFFSDGDVHEYFNPYESPYEAFINYMNVLSDFEIRLNTAMPETNTDKELAKLRVLVAEKEDLLKKYMSEVNKLKLNISKPKTSGTKKASSIATPGKTKTPGISKTGRKSTKASKVKKK